MRLARRDCAAIHATDWMVIDAVRYAMGRRTYQVGVTCGWVKSHWHLLDSHIQDVIRQDVECEFAAAERTGNYSHLGSNCDRQDWESVRALWRVHDNP